MFQFDLTKEPLTSPEWKAELQALKEMRKAQIKYSCISDLLHALIFVVLYFNNFLSGYAVLIAIATGTVVALVLATSSKDNLKSIQQITIGLMALATAVLTTMLLTMAVNETFAFSLVAGITAGSIVIVGATLGRKIKKVMFGIEAMQPIIDDKIALLEVKMLCRKFPELAEYRESATHNLRPHLTYGELAAMHKWNDRQH